MQIYYPTTSMVFDRLILSEIFSALATPGSGDVLTGMVTSFIAQGHKPEIAALLGSFVHGLAGRIASRTHGEAGTSASDIAACAGMAIDSIVNPHSEYKNII